MGIIIYGTKEIPIDVDEFLIKCPSCEKHSWADIMVMSKYFHVYWIPFFPTEKDANVICKTCELKRYGMSFDENLISNYYEIKQKFRHPWFSYIGLSIIVLFVLSIILSALI